jgi:hypothetical protein
MITKAEQESKEEVQKARQQAEEIRSGSKQKVDEVINRMEKLVTGA